MGLFYLELVLVPVAGRSEGRAAMPRKVPHTYGTDLPYLSKEARAGGLGMAATEKGEATAMPAFNNTALARYKAPLSVKGTGPGQPEMASFSSVNNGNLVDLFSGDFSYSIPLMEVGGYPVNLGYRAGISMDQEASWVGLGWNVNPGTVTRNLRGLPDDFNGAKDSIRKVMSIKENKTIGVTGGADIEIGVSQRTPMLAWV
ncbi:hypothetical protein [Paraflavitalea speifideaquila]|uniref:hypothetical protein n=1 Tax=Paraflavitalea speifideaquila TaxID=3076558 RepID=UPI0028E65B63|nr:hypothetical protein [Paraflavitalea speifideiaquila]